MTPNAARCGGDFRFAPCVAGTCGSPTHAPSLFCDTIQFAIETDRSCHRPGPGAELRSGLFSLPPICAPVPADLNLPGSKKPPGDAFFWLVPPASPRQPFPNPCRRAAHQNYSLFSILSSLAPLRPSPPTSREGQRAALSRGAEDQFPGSNAGLQNALSPRTAPPAGHRLILNPCRRAAHQNSSLFTLLYSLSRPCSFFPPGRTAKQKYILFFGHLTHNSARYNIGLNLIMEGKEYGKTGSA